MKQSRRIDGKYRRKPQMSRATSELIEYYGQFLKLDPDSSSSEELVTAMTVGYFHAGGHEDPDWPSKEEQIRNWPKYREEKRLEIIEAYRDDESAKKFLQETLRNSLLMIRIATDKSCEPTNEFHGWLLEAFKFRTFSVTSWSAPGHTWIKPVPYVPDNPNEFNLIFAVYRMGLVDAIVNAFTATTPTNLSNGSYYIGICQKCGLLLDLERPDQKFHPSCKQKYLPNHNRPRKEHEFSALGRQKISEAQKRRRERERAAKEALKAAIR
ncbi:MAG: hypothetical protein HQM09_23205 [Candidatus Riflebacteria bacterium]|nr:hypothetical protein [Candidatus Riflebacteria bacterium]